MFARGDGGENVREGTFAKGDRGQNVREGTFAKGDGGQNVHEGTFAKGDLQGRRMSTTLLQPCHNLVVKVVATLYKLVISAWAIVKPCVS